MANTKPRVASTILTPDTKVPCDDCEHAAHCKATADECDAYRSFVAGALPERWQKITRAPSLEIERRMKLSVAENMDD